MLVHLSALLWSSLGQLMRGELWLPGDLPQHLPSRTILRNTWWSLWSPNLAHARLGVLLLHLLVLVLLELLMLSMLLSLGILKLLVLLVMRVRMLLLLCVLLCVLLVLCLLMLCLLLLKVLLLLYALLHQLLGLLLRHSLLVHGKALHAAHHVLIWREILLYLSVRLRELRLIAGHLSISDHVGHARILHHALRGSSHHLRVRSGIKSPLRSHTSKLLWIKHHLWLLLLLLLVWLAPWLLIELGPSIAITKLSLEHGEFRSRVLCFCR